MSTHAPPPVGIDLGTTLSVIAFVDRHGTPRTILNSEGELTTPSAVLFEDSSIVVGREALKAAVHEPDRVATFAKRDMGGAHYHRPISGELVPPEVVQSLVLKKLKRDAEERIGPFREAVITVPAYFNEPRRKATEDAGRLAGLDVLDIINEPTAAAIAFGAREGLLDVNGQAQRPERILVYDLGGGTFDVTLMELNGPNYTTIGTAGDVYLGGVDWDRRLVDHVAELYLERHTLDPRVDESSLQRLLREAEEAKRALSSREKTSFVFEHGSEGLRVLVTRAQFESLTADLLERTLFTVRRVLKDASLKWTDLTRVLLVGGSTRMPAVRRMLSVETHLPLDRSLSPDEAVAHGAAIYASLLLAERRGEPTATVRDVNSHDLGVLGTEIATGRPRAAVVIPRNTPLPATRGRRFQTARQNQRSVVVKVIEGGDAAGRHATAIGDCVIRDLPRGLPAGSPVDVLFSYARNGRLVVRACLPPLEHEAVLAVERRSGLSDEALGRWKARLDDEDGPLALG